jgi:hypothetical protein
MSRSLCTLALGVCAALFPLPTLAQSNQDPAIDVRIANAANIQVLGREGVHPDGVNAVAFGTTVCNDGSVTVPWLQPMNENHPVIAFLVVAERGGRLEQISGRSFVKHGFFAANTVGCGRPCQQPPGQIGLELGIGCSDTYATSNNGDGFWLGPPDEVDPWLGTWDNMCSYFDRGEPSVPAPQDCDRTRSLTRAMVTALGPVGHRVRLKDADLAAPGRLYYQGQYVVRGEPGVARDNNLSSREFSATWNGSTWQVSDVGALLQGTVLQRWTGAEIAPASNGDDDGTVHAAVVVSGPVDGFYRYEYALHNRDNLRGVGALRIPVCPGARVRAPGFHDADDDPSNDWSASVATGEVVFATATAPLRWNSLYNFWFECDAAPAAGALTLDAFEPGPGAASLATMLSAPLRPDSVFLGAGCALGTPPTLFVEGTPPRAEIGNATFALASTGNAPLQPHWLRYGLQPGSMAIGACTLWIGSLASTTPSTLVASDATGRATHPLPIPPDPVLEGLEVGFQSAGWRPGGAVLGRLELSDALLVHVGNTAPFCP